MSYLLQLHRRQESRSTCPRSVVFPLIIFFPRVALQSFYFIFLDFASSGSFFPKVVPLLFFSKQCADLKSAPSIVPYAVSFLRCENERNFQFRSPPFFFLRDRLPFASFRELQLFPTDLEWVYCPVGPFSLQKRAVHISGREEFPF